LSVAAFAAAAIVLAGRGADKPRVLWEIAHNRCLIVEATAKECEFVDGARKYVILKDRVGKVQYLLIPTDRIAGIESPEILAPDAPNYWQEAWATRRFLERRANKAVPWNDVALAINSAAGRSQSQLHIHSFRVEQICFVSQTASLGDMVSRRAPPASHRSAQKLPCLPAPSAKRRTPVADSPDSSVA
jgi:CDP-diacylglycerol pyrophosphatase